MMKFSVCLIVLLLTISHFTVHSVPIRDMVEEQQPVMRETNTDSRIADISNSFVVNEFAHKLANISQPIIWKNCMSTLAFPKDH